VPNLLLRPHPPPPQTPSCLQECKSDDNEMATDNALSTLAALLEHHKDTLDANHVSQWEGEGLQATAVRVGHMWSNGWDS
jgi:hypothetical protein